MVSKNACGVHVCAHGACVCACVRACVYVCIRGKKEVNVLAVRGVRGAKGWGGDVARVYAHQSLKNVFLICCILPNY